MFKDRMHGVGAMTECTLDYGQTWPGLERRPDSQPMMLAGPTHPDRILESLFLEERLGARLASGAFLGAGLTVDAWGLFPSTINDCPNCGGRFALISGYCDGCPLTQQEAQDGWTVGQPLRNVCVRCGENTATDHNSYCHMAEIKNSEYFSGWAVRLTLCSACAKRLGLMDG